MLGKNSPEPGRWKTRRAEYLREIQDRITDFTTTRITVMKNSRSGVTEAYSNAIGYRIHYDPTKIAVFHPTESLAERYSRDVFDDMVEESAVLQGLVSSVKSRDSNNTILNKDFRGGGISFLGANTPANFRQINAGFIVKDDLDAFPITAGREGDPGKLADKRAQNYLNRKIVNVSKPTVKGLSRIEREYNDSSQAHYYVPCPHCDHYQILIFSPRSQFADLARGFLRYEYDGHDVKWVHYECGNCRKPIVETEKFRMVEQGRWLHKYPERLADHAGYHISQLYSPWSTWSEIVKDFEAAKTMIEELRAFVNDTLGESFEEGESYELKGDTLMDRREFYKKIPQGVIFLTAGADTQENRFEVTVRGWGLRGESWYIDRTVIHGSPDEDDTRRRLDDYLLETVWEHENGLKAGYGDIGGLVAVGIDSQGHFATTMYKYVKARQRHRFFALKGMAGFGKNIVHRDTRDRKIGARLIIVGVDTAKQLIYDRIRHVRAADGSYPPGYMHFSMNCDLEYFEQLSSERKMIKKVRGQPTQVWALKEGRRNEVLDCEVYALTALELLNPDYDKLKVRIDERMEQVKKDLTIDEAGSARRQETKKPAPPGRRKWRNPLLSRL